MYDAHFVEKFASSIYRGQDERSRESQRRPLRARPEFAFADGG